jgi:hypothetical protein
VSSGGILKALDIPYFKARRNLRQTRGYLSPSVHRGDSEKLNYFLNIPLNKLITEQILTQGKCGSQFERQLYRLESLGALKLNYSEF